MKENVKIFLEKMVQDPEAVVRFSEITDPDEAYKLASSIQGGFTKEEFQACMKELETAVKNSDLSDADLEKVAGGDTLTAAISAGVSAGASITIVGGLTAAAI